MVSINLSFTEKVLFAALAGAAQANLSIDEYIADCVTGAATSENIEEDFDAENVALQIYEKASMYKIGDQFNVEELHRHTFRTPWSKRTTGQRIAIGRAFKKLADSSRPLHFLDPKKSGCVGFVDKDQQNRAIYYIKAL